MTETELLDVLDENGKPTGKVLPRSEVHAKELWHASAFVWVVNSKGELLIQLRAEDRETHAGVWDVSAAGHISHGDTPKAAAVRELAEEVGIRADEDELLLLGEGPDSFPDIYGRTHPEYSYTFLLKRPVDAERFSLQKSEVTDAKWIPVAELEAGISKPGWDKKYAGRTKYIYESAITAVKNNN